LGQELVDLIGRNCRNIVGRLSLRTYLYIASANVNELYYSLSDTFLLCKSNILDTDYPSPSFCWGSSSFCVPFWRRGNVICTVIVPHSYCGFAWTCFMYSAEVSYGLKLVPIDSSDVGQEAPSDCKILVI